MTAKRKYYVVWKGKETGIFDSWDKCKRLVQGVSDAQYKSFKTKQEAEQAFHAAPLHSFQHRKVSRTPSPHPEEPGGATGSPILESISVDAAFNGSVMEYRGVYTQTKKELFKLGPFDGGTNNIGEFLAIVHALALLKKQGNNYSPEGRKELPVYSDSVTAIHWVKTHKANTKMKVTPANKLLFSLIERAEKWLQENNYPNRILKWETKAWGENPADFGRK